MMEMKSMTSNEISKPSASENQSFNPDKRIDVNQKQDTKESSEYDVDKRVSENNNQSTEKLTSDTIDDRVKSDDSAQENTDTVENTKADVTDKDFIVSKEPIGDAPKEVGNGVKNKEDGCAREDKFRDFLSIRYHKAFGYKILSERVLRDESGKIVKDPLTGQYRRVDFMVAKNGEVIKSFEVTSKSAPKDAQMAKESRIRENGGNYVKDTDGNLIKVPNNVTTEIVRKK